MVVVFLYYNFVTKNVNKADMFSTFIWIYYNDKILRYIFIIGIFETIFTKMYFVARLKYTHENLNIKCSSIINFTTLVFIGNIAAFDTFAFYRYLLCFPFMNNNMLFKYALLWNFYIIIICCTKYSLEIIWNTKYPCFGHII